MELSPMPLYKKAGKRGVKAFAGHITMQLAVPPGGEGTS